MRITLTVVEGPHRGLEFEFARHDTFLVGRSRHAHFQLPAKDKYFSRIHFMVEVNPPQCRLIDLGSHNGTYVNGGKVLSADLRNGDQIRAGHTLLAVAFHSSSEEAGSEEAGAQGVIDSGKPVSRFAIPGFSIDRELSRSPFGVIYLATCHADQSAKAIRVIVPSVQCTAQQIDSFLRDARSLLQLNHPNIVSLRDLGAHNGAVYFVSDHVPGSDAAAILKAGGPFGIHRALRLADQLLAALAYSHGRGFVHHNIRPGNLLITGSGADESLKLVDFGLTRVYDASPLSGLTITGDLADAAGFIAPEQITHFREPLPSVDQYAAAATLYTLLTNQCVFDLPAETSGQFSMILRQTPVPIQSRRADVPDSVAAAIHKALSRNPTNRFIDVAAFRKALAKAELAKAESPIGHSG